MRVLSLTWSSLPNQRAQCIISLVEPDSYNVHILGIRPVAVIDRTETHFIKIFFIWFSANTNILSCVRHFPELNYHAKAPLSPSDRRFSAGTLGPAAFGLGLRDSCLVILFFNLLCAIPPSYL